MSRFICCCAECHYAECHYAECHYAECHYAECHYAECYYAEVVAPSLLPYFCLPSLWPCPRVSVLTWVDPSLTCKYHPP